MKKRSSLSKKMVGVLATALSVTPAVVVHAAPAGVEINYFIDKDGPAEIIHLPELFSGATSFNDYNVSGAVYGHSTYTIDEHNDLIITPRTTIPLSENHDSNIDTIGFGVDGVEHTFNVQVVSKPMPVESLPDNFTNLTSPRNNNLGLPPLDGLFADEDNNTLHYTISPNTGSSSDTYAYYSGDHWVIHAGSSLSTMTFNVQAEDDDFLINNLTNHYATATFNVDVVNQNPQMGTEYSAYNDKTFDVEIGGMGLIIPKTQLFTDPDGDTLYYSYTGDYSSSSALSVYDLTNGNEMEIDSNQLGPYHVTVGVADSHEGTKALNFTVNVHPKLSFNSTGSPLYFNGATVSVRSSTAGTVYLVPTTETISSADQSEGLVIDNKASKILVTDVAADYPLQTVGLPMGPYRLYLLVGNSFYSPITSNSIYVTSSNFLSGLASTEGTIDVSSILKFLNGTNVAPLKELGLIDRNVIHSLIDRITPMIETGS